MPPAKRTVMFTLRLTRAESRLLTKRLKAERRPLETLSDTARRLLFATKEEGKPCR